jgi:hypothetical protein
MKSRAYAFLTVAAAVLAAALGTSSAVTAGPNDVTAATANAAVRASQTASEAAVQSAVRDARDAAVRQVEFNPGYRQVPARPRKHSHR